MENREVLEKLVEEYNTYAMSYRFYLAISSAMLSREEENVNRDKMDAIRDLIYKWFGEESVKVDFVLGKIFDVSFRWYKMEVR